MDLYMQAALVLRSEILHTIAHGLYVQEQSSLSHVPIQRVAHAQAGLQNHHAPGKSFAPTAPSPQRQCPGTPDTS